MANEIRIFMVRQFAKFRARNGILESDLIATIMRAEHGSIDADLGGGVIKQRIARLGAGKSSGYRTVIAFRMANRAIYMHGFAKGEQQNVSKKELDALKLLA